MYNIAHVYICIYVRARINLISVSLRVSWTNSTAEIVSRDDMAVATERLELRELLQVAASVVVAISA